MKVARKLGRKDSQQKAGTRKTYAVSGVSCGGKARRRSPKVNSPAVAGPHKILSESSPGRTGSFCFFGTASNGVGQLSGGTSLNSARVGLRPSFLVRSRY